MRKFFSSPIRVGMTCILSMVGLHILLYLGHKKGPPLVSEICAKIQGFSITPFFMEAGFFIFGFICVLTVNYFRTKWDGDEMVYLEVVDEPTEDLPPDSRAVVFSQPLPKPSPLEISIATIEGAIDSGDKTLASELIAALPTHHQQSPAVQDLIKSINKG